MHRREEAIQYAERFIGTFYIYGGDDPLGFDCSGFMIEILQSQGLFPGMSQLDYDETANSLYLRYIDNKRETPAPGCLVFWLKDGKAKHVEMLINDFQVIGASGGSGKVKTIEDAQKANAYIRIRTLKAKGGNYKILDPFKYVDPLPQDNLEPA